VSLLSRSEKNYPGQHGGKHKANMPTKTIWCKKTRGVSHCGLAIYIEKYLKTKEELWKTQIFISPSKQIIFKKSSKRNENPSRHYNSITNFNTSQNIIFQKNSHIKIDIIIP